MSDAVDEIGKSFRPQGLFAIAPGTIGLMVHLDHDGIRAGGHGGEGHLRNVFAQSNAMGWVNHHREFGFCFQDRDRIEVKSVARHRLKRADATLTQHHIRIALVENVFRTEEKITDGGAETALQHDRQPAAADFF